MVALLSALFFSSAFAITGFTVDNQPINPVCVWLLVNCSSDAGHSVTDKNNCLLSYFDSPSNKNLISAINLDACQASVTKGEVVKNANLISYNFPWGVRNDFNNSLKRGSFTYEYVGQTKNGIDVLHVFESGGGTGQFDSIMLLKRQQITQYLMSDNNQFKPSQFTQLSMLSSIPGGDRATGSFKTIVIKGNTLSGTRFNSKNLPNEQKYPNKKFRFKLPK